MITIEPITSQNVTTFKTVRLAALREAPSAFGSTYARESGFSDAVWLDRASKSTRERSAGYLAMDAPGACGIAWVTGDNQDSSVGRVLSVWVAPTHRRRGVGRLLINTVVAWAGDHEIRTLKLMVTSNNETALRFYQSLGFVATGNTQPYPNDPELVENEMARALS
jgi:ribosomal protein S18 acetylase RimI-like enzyme